MEKEAKNVTNGGEERRIGNKRRRRKKKENNYEGKWKTKRLQKKDINGERKKAKKGKADNKYFE